MCLYSHLPEEATMKPQTALPSLLPTATVYTCDVTGPNRAQNIWYFLWWPLSAVGRCYVGLYSSFLEQTRDKGRSSCGGADTQAGEMADYFQGIWGQDREGRIGRTWRGA